jgi:hypothetical protein
MDQKIEQKDLTKEDLVACMEECAGRQNLDRTPRLRIDALVKAIEGKGFAIPYKFGRWLDELSRDPSSAFVIDNRHYVNGLPSGFYKRGQEPEDFLEYQREEAALRKLP